MAKKYKESFYSERHANTIYSANRIIELVQKLVSPESVADVGCGVGTWLKVFQEYGVRDILGIEGLWVDENAIVIPKNNFLKTDLEKEFKVDRGYDLAISLEVAEHIHETASDQFIQNIVNLAPVILFSAAIPLQAGKHHVNEQWPVYWKNKFATHNYVVIDCIRPEIWEDDKVEMWYAQNSFIYVRKDKLNDYPQLSSIYEEDTQMLSVVHPRFYEHKLRTWPIMKAIRNRIKRAIG